MVNEQRTWYLYRGRGLLEVVGPIGRGQHYLLPPSYWSHHHKNQTPGRYPKEYIQDSKHGESLKSRIFGVLLNKCAGVSISRNLLREFHGNVSRNGVLFYTTRFPKRGDGCVFEKNAQSLLSDHH